METITRIAPDGVRACRAAAASTAAAQQQPAQRNSSTAAANTAAAQQQQGRHHHPPLTPGGPSAQVPEWAPDREVIMAHFRRRELEESQ